MSDWRDRFVLTRDTANVGERVALARRADAGELARVAPGVFLPSAEIGARVETRIADLARARQLIASEPLVFSHTTAAALWGLPLVATPIDETRAHVIDHVAGGGRSKPGLIRHVTGMPEVDRVDGLFVTTLAQTVVDVARTLPFGSAVAVADRAMRGVTHGGQVARVSREELEGTIRGTSASRGVRSAREVVAFADPLADRPGESLSRCTMHRYGLPKPELQREFRDRQGVMRVDFCWPHLRTIGEFDGLGKYLREEWMDGRSAAEVVIDEKKREDRLRDLGWKVVRWGWPLALRPAALRAYLAEHGIR